MFYHRSADPMDRFLTDLRQNDCILSPDLRIHRGEDSGIRFMFSPDRAHIAVARAFQRVRRGKSLLTSNRAVPQNIAAEYADPSFQTLISILNQTINSDAAPHANPGSGHFVSKAVKGIGSCHTSEGGFGLAFAQMQQPDRVLPGQVRPIGYELITNDSGAVIAVGKGYGEPSALTLDAIAVNGCLYPAGVIMRADDQQHRGRQMFATKKPHYIPVSELNNYTHPREVPSSTLVDVAPTRLSAYSYLPDDRFPLFDKLNDGLPEVAQPILHEATLDDLRSIAQTALSTI